MSGRGAMPGELIRYAIAAIAALIAVACGSIATAGTLSILPVRIEVAPQKQFCSLTVSNQGAEAVTVQVRGYGWRQQADGKDVLDPAAGVRVNPSIVAIPAGAKRLIRCSLPPQSGQAESAYRLLVNELPVAATRPGTVQALLQISIPVFRAPAGASPILHWSLDDSGRLVLSNEGTRHAQVTHVIIKRASVGDPAMRIDRTFYLLAGSRVGLPADALQAGDITGVVVETADGRLMTATRAPR